MSTLKKRLVLLVPLFIIISLACNLPIDPQTPSASRLKTVLVSPTTDQPDFFFVEVHYYKDSGDDDYKIYCTWPDRNGVLGASTEVDTSGAYGTSPFTIVVKIPGKYVVTCNDENVTASAEFTVTEAVTTFGQDTNPAAPSTDEQGSFAIPKPGAFNNAGMWMYFDEGTSSLEGYGVPQQCLPGVNYTHVGGTSSFDIDPAGNITGACGLNYGGTTFLSGTITGTWDGTTDMITFRLETVTEGDYVLNDQAGHMQNKTLFTGTAEFNSAIQASGTANWSTVCTTTNPSVAGCKYNYFEAELKAEGTVPFVINFENK